MGKPFTHRSRIKASAQAVFCWHELPETLERLMPPWETTEILERSGGIQDGARVTLRIGRWPFRVIWIAEHCGYVPGRQFRDVQVRGPFKHFVHTHSMIPDGPDACWLEDHIEYVLPLGGLGHILLDRYVRRRLRRLFEYRHQVTAQAVARSHGNDAAR